MTELRRSVPFLAQPCAGGADRILLLDRAEIRSAHGVRTELQTVLARAVDLGSADRCYSADEVEALVEQQYQSCLEFIYGHPVWQAIRNGTGRAELLSYLFESRHYLAAAPFRMASGIGDALRPSELVRLQAHHVVEEADHDQYFENGLAELGCPRALIKRGRPSPVTVEWVHLMRTVAAYSTLAAGICSGLLEYTAGDTDSVRGWHDMLVQDEMLPQGAVRAIFEHVETDLGLGHGSNWREAVQAARVVPAQELADLLNSVTLVAEMIVRWLDTFPGGLSADVVEAMPGLEVRPDAQEPIYAGEIDGLPVWPAEVYASFAHGPSDQRKGVRQSMALAYAFAGDVDDPSSASGTSPARAAMDLTGKLGCSWNGASGAGDLAKLVDTWMTAIDGHELWSVLRGEPTYPLVYGWMAENYHYVAGIWQHTGAALSTCPDPAIRAELVKHLVEEFNHGRMFRKGIDKGRSVDHVGPLVGDARPLPTTIALVGTLREISQRDWKAYLLVLGFLQLSLSASEGGVAERHERFYAQMFDQLPSSRALVSAMRRHDAEDTSLGHQDDTFELLRLLADRHDIGRESVAAAALAPQMTWSFLDGILQHYRHGDGAVLQRLGWHTSA